MTIAEIKNMPLVKEHIHESTYRSYHILNMVLEMIERGDSKETIVEVVNFLRQEESA